MNEDKIFGHPDPEEFETNTPPLGEVVEEEPNDLDDYRDAQDE